MIGRLAGALVLTLPCACGQSVVKPIDGFVPAPDLASVCPDDLPPSCPTPQPSWTTDVAPLVFALCADCHKPGGSSPTKPLLTYDQVFQRRSAVLDQIYSCFMPPDTETPLTPSERQILLSWLVCGAPDN